MADGEGFLMRPILAGMCHYESITNGALDLWDFVIMNEALDVRDENEARIYAARAKQR